MPRVNVLAAAAALLLSAAAAAPAQEAEAPPADSLAAAGADSKATGDTVPAAPRPRGRWSTPFAVEGSGRASIERDPRPDVVRRDGPRRPAPVPVPDSVPLSPDSAAADSSTAAAPPARPGRAAARDSVRIPPRTPTPAAGAGRTGTAATGTGRTATTPARPRTHTVAPGETFFGIARRYGVTSDALRAANPDARWESVRIGDELRIPPARAAAATPARAGGEAPRRGAAARRVHVVEPGQTLFGIARRYGVRPKAIQDANDMDGDQVRIGQRLVIPAS